MNSFVGFEFKKMFRKKMLIVQVILVILVFIGSFIYWSQKDNATSFNEFYNHRTVFQSKNKAIANIEMLVEEQYKVEEVETLHIDTGEPVSKQFDAFLSGLKTDDEKKGSVAKF